MASNVMMVMGARIANPVSPQPPGCPAIPFGRTRFPLALGVGRRPLTVDDDGGMVLV